PVAWPDHGSLQSIWSLTSNTAESDERRQLPSAHICHQLGTGPSAEVMCTTTSMPLSFAMPAGGLNEPTSSSEPELRSHAKLRFAVPSQPPQRRATPDASAVDANTSSSSRQPRRFKRASGWCVPS